MKKLKTGDTVELKSGSPKMTVRNYSSKSSKGKMVSCQWYDYNSYEFKKCDFLEGQLQLKESEMPEAPEAEKEMV
ncbi:MAG: DUF2158 domain-containing protein [Bacteroidetes bacterium]|nr:DUF2158 domain-containing protein [Bacteroidota bacterium]